ncbi:hypothetical protein EDD18DRAFT_1107629 [Armillaria luteobubalina]|uniref:Uncharacterized protein n=1 Tax=Armillaria luteobubalina TaxID=153913 RepID=A0AA39Q2M9_9AGAR|nr:hypothetical protein EDD18DRAFT_1107629 [Armillaria luteobubalina]
MAFSDDGCRTTRSNSNSHCMEYRESSLLHALLDVMQRCFQWRGGISCRKFTTGHTEEMGGLTGDRRGSGMNVRSGRVFMYWRPVPSSPTTGSSMLGRKVGKHATAYQLLRLVPIAQLPLSPTQSKKVIAKDLTSCGSEMAPCFTKKSLLPEGPNALRSDVQTTAVNRWYHKNDDHHSQRREPKGQWSTLPPYGLNMSRSVKEKEFQQCRQIHRDREVALKRERLGSSQTPVNVYRLKQGMILNARSKIVAFTFVTVVHLRRPAYLNGDVTSTRRQELLGPEARGMDYVLRSHRADCSCIQHDNDSLILSWWVTDRSVNVKICPSPECVVPAQQTVDTIRIGWRGTDGRSRGSQFRFIFPEKNRG